MSHLLRLGRTAVVVIVSAATGAGAALWWQSAHLSPGGPHRQPIEQEFVPEQELTLADGAGQAIGRLSVSDDAVILNLYTANEAWVTATVYSDSSRVYLQCAGNHENTSATVNANGTDVSDLRRGFILGQWTDPTMWNRIRYAFMSSRGKRFDDSPNVTTEDLRLRNRKGWVFASLGLSSSGDPGMAFADSNGSVRLTFFQRQFGERNWWDLAIWDIAGAMRVSLELRPGLPPDMVHLADDQGAQYVADFPAHRLIHKDDAHSGVLSWLPLVRNFAQSRSRPEVATGSLNTARLSGAIVALVA